MKAILASLLLACAALGGATASQPADVDLDAIERALAARGDLVAPVDGYLAVTLPEGLVMIFVHGDDSDVSYISYLTDFALDAGDFAFFNAFNRDVKFARIYQLDDGGVVLQMDRNASGGVSLDNVLSDVDVIHLHLLKLRDDYDAWTH